MRSFAEIFGEVIKIATLSNYWNYLHSLCGPESCTLLDVAPRESWLKYLKIWRTPPSTIRSVLLQSLYKNELQKQLLFA